MSGEGLPVAGGGATQKAIEHHYDVGREFYRLWLDVRMVYSCALWTGELDDDLEAAQLAKLDWHATGARADGAARVLDVGCGWGAMMRYLTDERQVGHVTGLTLSSDQAAAVPSRTRSETRLEDWRDHQPPAPYDAIVSIGAFEHFARPELDKVRAARRLPDLLRALRPLARRGWAPVAADHRLGGLRPRHHGGGRFFTQDIFPESSLPQLSDVIEAAEGWFRLVSFRSDATHYEHTLRLWRKGSRRTRRRRATSSVGSSTAATTATCGCPG